MVTVELTEKELREIVARHLNEKLGSLSVAEKDVKFLVKSKQNYRSTWEECGVVITNRIEKYIPELKVEAKA
jgi:RNase P/RNase MRP subunit POP5